MTEHPKLEQLVKWTLDLPKIVQLLFGAVATAVPFYFAAFLSIEVDRVAKINQRLTLGVHAAVFLVLLTIVVLLQRIFNSYREQLTNREQSLLALRLHAYAYLDRFVLQQTQRANNRLPVNQDFVSRFVASQVELQEIVDAAYNACEAAYGKSARTEERIDFEVTFMAKSYVDGYITIPACANRDGRAPRSMVLRQRDNQIYDKTVTAALYRDDRPCIRIIEDTASHEAKYEELYPKETERIRSTVVFPVLSNTNVLLGTMVAHCDRTNFFRHRDEKYWTDLFEIFAKRLALVKLKLDLMVGVQNSFEVACLEKPF